MADYQAKEVTGHEWQRCYRVVVTNNRNSTPTITFEEQKVIVLPDREKINNGSSSAYGSAFTNADVIGVALDMDAGTLTFYKNNVSQGTAFTGLTGTFFASVSNFSPGFTSATANFGATAFVYSPPSGFNAGLYN